MQLDLTHSVREQQRSWIFMPEVGLLPEDFRSCKLPIYNNIRQLRPTLRNKINSLTRAAYAPLC